MRRTILLNFFLTVLMVSFATIGYCAFATNPWPLVKTPSKQNPNVIGGYSAGCIAGASVLPLEGQGYQVMRTSRHRYFGHPILLQFIENLGARAAAIDGILVGDLAQPRGGPTGSLHVSHQTGLDVDVWYDQAPGGQIMSYKERETMSAHIFIADNEKTVNKYWTRHQTEILRAAAESQDVDRIFVAPAIKKFMCVNFPGHAFLRKLRPWYGHADHFHARLVCPAGNSNCQVQDPVPDGDGCKEADEWLTDEAIAEREKQSHEPPKPFKMPVLPKLCQDVLESP